MKRALAAAVVLVAGVAHAETPPGVWDKVADPQAGARYELHLRVQERLASREMVVTLKNLYEGELVERVPNDHVTIKTIYGELKTFTWSEIISAIDRVDGTHILLRPREYRGGLVEDVPNDHVTIRTASGDLKTFSWDDIDDTQSLARPDKVQEFDEFQLENLENVRAMLVRADAEHSPDPRLRLDLGHVLQMFERYAEAAAMLESGLGLAPDHPMAEDALFQLAICNAHLDPEKELKTYDRYLKLATRPEQRAIAYSNRAEAEMGLGHLEEAIEDSRYAASVEGEVGSIRGLAQFDLAIALDRYGDPRGAAQAADWAVNDSEAVDEIMGLRAGVFFVPEYNTHWYRALALSALSRKVHDPAVQVGMLRVAVTEWANYVAKADPTDRWLQLAGRHRDETLKKADDLKSRLPKDIPPPSHIGPYRVP